MDPNITPPIIPGQENTNQQLGDLSNPPMPKRAMTAPILVAIVLVLATGTGGFAYWKSTNDTGSVSTVVNTPEATSTDSNTTNTNSMQNTESNDIASFEAFVADFLIKGKAGDEGAVRAIITAKQFAALQVAMGVSTDAEVVKMLLAQISGSIPETYDLKTACEGNVCTAEVVGTGADEGSSSKLQFELSGGQWIFYAPDLPTTEESAEAKAMNNYYQLTVKKSGSAAVEIQMNAKDLHQMADDPSVSSVVNLSPSKGENTIVFTIAPTATPQTVQIDYTILEVPKGSEDDAIQDPKKYSQVYKVESVTSGTEAKTISLTFQAN